MADEQSPDQPVDVSAITEQVLAKIAEHVGADVFTDMLGKSLLKALTALAQGIGDSLKGIARLGGKALVAAEEPVLPIFSEFVEPIISNMFGSEMPSGAFASRGNRGARAEGARALVNAYMDAIADANAGGLEPSDEGAKRIAGAAVHATLEGWFNGWILEMLGDCVPIEWMHFKDLTELSEEVIRSLGVGRLVRRAVAPLVDVAAATPMRWKVNKQYRPTLLSPAQAIRQAYRGNWDWADVQEICEREGYSDAAISALINEQRKFQSVADVRQLVTRGEWTSDRGLQHLRDQGYDEDGATLALRIEGLRRIEQHESSVSSALLSAFVARDIDDLTFARVRDTAIGPPAERALLTELGQIRRELNVKRLSASEVRAAVKAGILAMVDYRGWLAREGYDDDDALTLELLLRAELDADFQADKAREEAAAERAAAKAARDQVAKQRLADVEAERARRARGSIADLSRAVVRGLIPIARLEEVLAADYDADTVGILVGLVEDDRHRYLAQQQKADDARQAAARRAIDVGALEAAVLEQVLTVDEFRARLEALDFAPDDVQILTATIAAKLADRLAAEAKRRDAVVKADAKKIDLSRFEQLVRRGVRTLAEYDALLQGLGYDDASRAALDQLLQLHIADDRAAEDARRAAREADAHKGVTLEQLRRAVVLGLQAPGDYEAFLVQNGFTSDAVAVLMGELADDVTQADAARRRRDAADAARAKPALPLATLARAARLGIVPMATYQQRLVDDGYSSDDVAIEMDLLTAEIADTQAARDRQAAADAAPATVGVSLSQLERGVRAGTATLEDYRARAIAIGLAADDVDTLTRIIGDEALTSQAARARRAELASTLETKNLALGPLEDQVRRGELSIDNYHAALVGAGVALDDAALLAGLLAASLAAG
jgi:hypothetical protein